MKWRENKGKKYKEWERKTRGEFFSINESDVPRRIDQEDDRTCSLRLAC